MHKEALPLLIPLVGAVCWLAVTPGARAAAEAQRGVPPMIGGPPMMPAPQFAHVSSATAAGPGGDGSRSCRARGRRRPVRNRRSKPAAAADHSHASRGGTADATRGISLPPPEQLGVGGAPNGKLRRRLGDGASALRTTRRDLLPSRKTGRRRLPRDLFDPDQQTGTVAADRSPSRHGRGSGPTGARRSGEVGGRTVTNGEGSDGPACGLAGFSPA